MKNKTDLRNDTIKNYYKIILEKYLDSKIIIDNLKQKPDLSDRKKYVKLMKSMRSNKNITIIAYKNFMNYFNEWNKYYVFMQMNNQETKLLEVYENPEIQGFKYRKKYYNINSECVTPLGKYKLLFYSENNSAPISLLTAKFITKQINSDEAIKNSYYELETNPSSLIKVVNGQAFKSISNLGKEPMKLDFLYVAIIIGIIAVTILQLTGQIDLMSMMNLQ